MTKQCRPSLWTGRIALTVAVVSVLRFACLPASAEPYTGRVDNNAWIASDWNATPFAITSSDENTANLRASTGHLQSFARTGLERKIHDAKALAPENFKLPKLAAPVQAPLDLWTELDVNADNSGATQTQRTAVGADYIITRGLTSGVAVEHADVTTESAATRTSVGSYIALTPFANTVFDTRTSWQETDNGALGATSSTSVTSRARSQWDVAKMKFVPSVSFTAPIEGESGTETDENGKIVFDPRMSRPIAIDEETSLEPFVRYANESDLSGTTAAESIGGGIELNEKDGYSLSVSTDVEQKADTEASDVKSRLQFKMPLP